MAKAAASAMAASTTSSTTSVGDFFFTQTTPGGAIRRHFCALRHRKQSITRKSAPTLRPGRFRKSLAWSAYSRELISERIMRNMLMKVMYRFSAP